MGGERGNECQILGYVKVCDLSVCKNTKVLTIVEGFNKLLQNFKKTVLHKYFAYFSTPFFKGKFCCPHSKLVSSAMVYIYEGMVKLPLKALRWAA